MHVTLGLVQLPHAIAFYPDQNKCLDLLSSADKVLSESLEIHVSKWDSSRRWTVYR